MRFHYNVCLVFCQLKFSICVRCDMAFIEPMHRNKPNITYLLTRFTVSASSSIATLSPYSIATSRSTPIKTFVLVCDSRVLPSSWWIHPDQLIKTFYNSRALHTFTFMVLQEANDTYQVALNIMLAKLTHIGLTRKITGNDLKNQFVVCGECKTGHATSH